MSLRFNVLASGSTGNALLVQTDEKTILIDAGLSGRKLEQLMTQVGFSVTDLDGILITHEHSDHIKGLGAFARKHRLPVFANQATWNAMGPLIGDIDVAQQHIFKTGDQLEFGGLHATSYAISHDAAEPVGYTFRYGDRKLGLATDLGYASTKVKETIFDSDMLILESNHDVELLRMGKYPWNIKRRILGDSGHLSNEAAGEALVDLLEGRTRNVFLAHLSLQHNMIDLARMSVTNVLRERGVDLQARGVAIHDTYHDRPIDWQVIK
jgi:phosphoribosyl 1,2-cyclic phosphodiesterase